ncbi:MAG: elongation factor 4 [Alphaproteobacteria bacterium]|nr:elongation factor 4 [Alphaproteobacteria bacterium]MBL0717830.1 elongation factor 4 [Alphaproteobacteria bacterium]
MIDQSKIRNFSIIAHIDHGKSTLSDRIIQHCGGLSEREMEDRVLDSMDIEKERGITIKAQTVRLKYKAKDGETYLLNLIDTPGHVDFSYEVSKSLEACEGSILLVDASQGVQAQTLANSYLSIEADNKIIVSLNKIDLPQSDVERVKLEIEDVIGISTEDAIEVSGKTGMGVEKLLESVIKDLPPPKGDISSPLKALLVDSWYDIFRGVIILVRVIDGSIKKGDGILFMETNRIYTADYVGYFSPKMVDGEELKTGEIGYIITGMKTVSDCMIGDTITASRGGVSIPLAGFKPSIAVVYSSFFPVDTDDYQTLKGAVEKLSLNDSSFKHSVETSTALGFGIRCGFLGLLHMSIILERLTREFNLDLINTVPSVNYEIERTNGEIAEIQNPADLPDPSHIKSIAEPWVRITVMLPQQYIGSLMELCIGRRGIHKDMRYTGERAILEFEIPLSEIIFDFYDKLKSLSQGYASLDYEIIGYRKDDLIKIGILINGEIVEPLSFMSHRGISENRGRKICERLKELIPRHQFQIAIQAAHGGKIIARSTISAMRKDVTAKCYGGDISRKRKLLEKQKKGKKKMKQFGNVSIPQNVFIKALQISED